MSEYKPITGEIREQMDQAERIYPIVDGMQNTQVRINLAWLTERLDEIDAIHAALEAECERLREQNRDGWVELPKDGEAPSKQLAEWIESRGLVTGPLDADGELWHEGDMSDSPWGEIESIVFYGHQWQVSGHDTSAPWIPANSISHYHHDTWERIIEDAIRGDGGSYGCLEERFDAMVPALVARCKALSNNG